MLPADRVMCPPSPVDPGDEGSPASAALPATGIYRSQSIAVSYSAQYVLCGYIGQMQIYCYRGVFKGLFTLVANNLKVVLLLGSFTNDSQ